MPGTVFNNGAEHTGTMHTVGFSDAKSRISLSEIRMSQFDGCSANLAKPHLAIERKSVKMDDYYVYFPS